MQRRIGPEYRWSQLKNTIQAREGQASILIKFFSRRKGIFHAFWAVQRSSPRSDRHGPCPMLPFGSLDRAAARRASRGGSAPASKKVGQTKKELVERYGIRNRWWTQLVERSANVTKLHAHITPSEYSWIGTSSGISGLNFNCAPLSLGCLKQLHFENLIAALGSFTLVYFLFLLCSSNRRYARRLR